MCCIFFDKFLPRKLNLTLEACFACGIFGKALFTGFLCAYHLGTVILKESPLSSLLSHLHQCFSFSFPYLFIPPLFHLSPYFRLNFFLFLLFPPLPFITVLCDAYLVAVSHPLFHWEKSKASKRGMVGAVFLCVCSFGHV